MKAKSTIKKITDAAMLVLMPLLAAKIQLGQPVHEWMGAVMAVLFLLHHILNYKWFKSMFKGDYSLLRTFTTILNILLLADAICLIYSGIRMSGFVFSWISLPGRNSTARTLHLFTYYWGLILMSVHTGVHSGLHVRSKNTADDSKSDTSTASRTLLISWLIIGIVCVLSAFGIYAFIRQNISSYLFMRTHFMFYDETKGLFLFLFETISIMILFMTLGHYITVLMRKLNLKSTGKKISKILAFAIPVIIFVIVIFVLNNNPVGKHQYGNDSGAWNTEMQGKGQHKHMNGNGKGKNHISDKEDGDIVAVDTNLNDGLIYIKGGTFKMGSPDDENWRSEDETQHTVTVSDFYMSPYELTQKEYVELVGNNPSNFNGDDLPVENITWLDTVSFCNALSESRGLKPVYITNDNAVTWDRSADGYRLPTEAEWEYACRAGTDTPFNTEEIPGADGCNFYGHYPYQIEQNYFTQNKLSTKPGEYRQTTVSVDSFAPNGLGLYNMHGNVSEWVWDYYGEYDINEQQDPTGALSGNLRVYRGGGWNDFGKNTRSAYRGTMAQNMASFNVGMRLVRNAEAGNGTVSSEDTRGEASDDGKILIAFFSWGGNTRGIAHKIQEKTGADIFEIELVKPYSTDYNTVLDEAQHDQNIQARPEIVNKIDNFDDYSIIMIGYPNWWASIPMPIASLLEEYDFSDKTIIPFCSHGGGRFGQSITAISKLAPNAVIGEGLSVHYSGGSTLDADIDEWLEKNHIRGN